MALNFSYRPIFPAQLSDDNLVSPMKIANGCLVEGIPERNRDGFVNHWPSSREVHDRFDYGAEDMDLDGSEESVSKDILDVLPADPFGMDMDISSTVTAITGWLEDLEADYGGYGRAEVGVGRGDCPLFAEFNFLLNKSIGFQAFPRDTKADNKMLIGNRVYRCSQENELVQSLGDDVDVLFACTMEGVKFGNANASINRYESHHEVTELVADTGDRAPHPALSFALAYLGVHDLLSVERVCKSLCCTIQNDPLLWQSIHIDKPLNDRITDDVLLHLTSRAQGHLQCLSLVECQRVTDDGIKCVLESNLRLTKLSVPGCTKLSIDGILSCLRAFKMVAITGIKYLRIGGLYGVTQKHFEELISLLGIQNLPEGNHHKPHYYHRGSCDLSCEDEGRWIDIEMCPRCQNLRLVYDCPAESCQGKDHTTQLCRGCILCIPRCVQCGKCINDGEYEETFCLEFLCSECWKEVLQCQGRQDIRVSSSNHAAYQEPASSFHG